MSVERRGTKALELWAKRATQGYRGVSVDNMTTSWRDGLAFCALIHHFKPDLIDFVSLKAENILENNDLAFRVAEQQLGIPALLDAEDMLESPVPDRLSILTYVSQFYQAFASQGLIAKPNSSTSPASKSVKDSSSEKENDARAAPSSNASTVTPSKTVSTVTTNMNTPVPQKAKSISNPPSTLQTKRETEFKTDKVSLGIRGRREECFVCHKPVFLAERILVGSPVHLRHRTCFRCARCSAQLTLANYYETEKGEFCCETCPDEEKPLDDSLDLDKNMLSSDSSSDSDSDSSHSQSSLNKSAISSQCSSITETDSPALKKSVDPLPRTKFLQKTLSSDPDTRDSKEQNKSHFVNSIVPCANEPNVSDPEDNKTALHSETKKDVKDKTSDSKINKEPLSVSDPAKSSFLHSQDISNRLKTSTFQQDNEDTFENRELLKNVPPDESNSKLFKTKKEEPLSSTPTIGASKVHLNTRDSKSVPEKPEKPAPFGVVLRKLDKSTIPSKTVDEKKAPDIESSSISPSHGKGNVTSPDRDKKLELMKTYFNSKVEIKKAITKKDKTLSLQEEPSGYNDASIPKRESMPSLTFEGPNKASNVLLDKDSDKNNAHYVEDRRTLEALDEIDTSKKTEGIPTVEQPNQDSAITITLTKNEEELQKSSLEEISLSEIKCTIQDDRSSPEEKIKEPDISEEHTDPPLYPDDLNPFDDEEENPENITLTTVDITPIEKETSIIVSSITDPVSPDDGKISTPNSDIKRQEPSLSPPPKPPHSKVNVDEVETLPKQSTVDTLNPFESDEEETEEDSSFKNIVSLDKDVDVVTPKERACSHSAEAPKNLSPPPKPPHTYVEETPTKLPNQEEKPVPLNPFESDEETEEASEIIEQPPTARKNTNPFWSDEEDDSGQAPSVTPRNKAKPPRPPPPTIKRNEPPPPPPPTKKLILPSAQALLPPSPTPSSRSASSDAGLKIKKKLKPAPAPPLSDSPHKENDEVLSSKMQKDMKNQTNKLISDAASSHPKHFGVSKSEAGEWRRKKGPAPPRPMPQKRVIHKLPLRKVQQELQDIEIQQTELERQGVLLETAIRDKTEQRAGAEDSNISTSDSYNNSEISAANLSQGPMEVEDMILQLFELVNEKNELFRRQTELMYIKREKRLEEEHAELEYQIRCLMLKPASERRPEDELLEEDLLARLCKVVDQRDEVINCLELERQREAVENESIASHMIRYQEKYIDGIVSSEDSEVAKKKKKKKLRLLKKKKKKDKEREKVSKVDADKDVDETEITTKTQKSKKKNWFRKSEARSES